MWLLDRVPKEVYMCLYAYVYESELARVCVGERELINIYKLFRFQSSY